MSAQPGRAAGAQLNEQPGLPPSPAIPASVTGILAVLALVGGAAFVATAYSGSPRAWQAFLVNLLFWLGIAQGGVVISSAYYLTQGRWAGTMAFRMAEAFSLFIPVGLVLFFILYFGRTAVFPWVSHPVPDKAQWLNTPFLFARDGIALLWMTALSMIFVNVSRGEKARAWTQHSSNIHMPPKAIKRLAVVLAISYAFVYSLIAFDLVMSLSPQWHSTLFGWFFFAGAFWSAVVMISLVTVLLGRRFGPQSAFSRPGLLHDLGKFTFAFSVFWVYLLFSQYIVIWYGDIPVETFFVVLRVNTWPWWPLSWLVLVLVWLLPFTVLMGVKPKKTPAILGTIAALGLAGMWLERYVLVVPSLSPRELPLGLAELLITLGFLGVFGLCSLPGIKYAIAAAASAGPKEAR